MKIGIITLHSIYNPGSALQAYALNKFLKINNIDNEIIDYRPAYSTIGKNKIKGIITRIIYSRNIKTLKKRYESFINDNMIVTRKQFHTYKELQTNPPVFDIYMTGSDQLWNEDYDCGRDSAYYLKFVNDIKKVAYSTSIGKSMISPIELAHLKEKIKDFSNIAVREENTSLILSKVLGKDVKWVCDPVFLLEANAYSNFIGLNKYGNYAVVYLSARSKLLDDVVDKLKKDYKLKIIQAGGNMKRCNADILISDIGPKEFLTLINHSKLVVCSSFHAIAYSHILHKNFIALLPKPNGERISSLLNLSGLSWKMINDISRIEECIKEPDYEDVDKRLIPFIQKSKEYLLSICKVKK